MLDTIIDMQQYAATNGLWDSLESLASARRHISSELETCSRLPSSASDFHDRKFEVLSENVVVAFR